MYARYARLEIDFFKYIYYAKIFSSPPPLQKSRKRPWSTSKTALKAPRRSSSVMCPHLTSRKTEWFGDFAQKWCEKMLAVNGSFCIAIIPATHVELEDSLLFAFHDQVVLISWLGFSDLDDFCWWWSWPWHQNTSLFQLYTHCVLTLWEFGNEKLVLLLARAKA